MPETVPYLRLSGDLHGSFDFLERLPKLKELDLEDKSTVPYPVGQVISHWPTKVKVVYIRSCLYASCIMRVKQGLLRSHL